MIVKYFDKGKGRTGPVEYVLDKERVASGEAKLLRGDAHITAQLIKTNNNELKYRSGVLTFTEVNVSSQIKQEIMSEFERSTFAGLDKDQYNILWVEHKDKDKTELHFVIPRLELSTQKAFNPHWHKADQDRLMLFQDIQNSKYNLTNPYEQERANTLQVPTQWDNRSKAKEEIHEVIIQGVSNGQLQNRDQIVEFLENSGLEVKRSNKGKLSKNFIAVREAETEDYIRLKGVYYNESYTSTAEVTKQLSKREQKHTFTTQEQLRKAEQKFDEAIQTKARFNNERYQRAEQKQDISKSLNINIESNSNNRSNERSIITSTEISNGAEQQSNSKNTRDEEMASTRRSAIRIERRREVHQSNRISTEREQINLFHTDNRKGLDNEDRATTAFTTTASEDTEAITRQREAKYRAYREARQSRVELHQAITEQSKELRKQSKQNSIELSREYATVTKQSRELVNRAKEITEQSESSARFSNKLSRFAGVIREYKDKLTSYIKDTRDSLKEQYNKFIRAYNSLTYKLKETKEIIKATTEEKKPELSINDVEKFRVSVNKSIDYHNSQVQHQSKSYEMSM